MKPEPAPPVTADADNLSVDIDIGDDGWLAALVEPEQFCSDVVRSVIGHLALPARPYEVSVVLISDDRQRELNRVYRGRDAATNVLSFPSAELDNTDFPPELPLPLGDITLALETITREAADMAFRDHFCHLLVHGMLHLVGYDHETNDDAACMEALEIRILDARGVKNPYADSVVTGQN
ncbi:MAG: rRNA maturation RNase YbeY [Rhodospirillales bacterium]